MPPLVLVVSFAIVEFLLNVHAGGALSSDAGRLSLLLRDLHTTVQDRAGAEVLGRAPDRLPFRPEASGGHCPGATVHHRH